MTSSPSLQDPAVFLPGEVVSLLRVVFTLWVDPRSACALHSCLEQAAAALMLFLPEPSWKDVRVKMAEDLAGLCPWAPHATLRLLMLLPTHTLFSRRATDLRQHAALLVLQELTRRHRKVTPSTAQEPGCPPDSPLKQNQRKLVLPSGVPSNEDAVAFAVNALLACPALNPLLQVAKGNIDYWLVLVGLKLVHLVVWDYGCHASEDWGRWSHFLKRVNMSIKTTLQQSRAEVKHYAGKWHMDYEKKFNETRRTSLGENIMEEILEDC
eukprot:CAMPEP_0196586180 /NCGR_PEP_ID=MMETSP1081-20130531/53441_1 /TAXON_ID=36882 /ORGANISM="Pyramimonas amylifera, Strain CCMP720" /LENGTH=266 /DNA_ID=CAMNT_0041907975 /DNA_START=14 /DNA_END=814 /DNA_ORIENTATION=-